MPQKRIFLIINTILPMHIIWEVYMYISIIRYIFFAFFFARIG